MDDKSNISRRRLLLAGGATVAFGGGVAYFASRSESAEGEPGQGQGQGEGGDGEYVPATFNTSDGSTGFGVELAGRPIIGENDAPVDIYYWTDYLCPFCKKFEVETLPKLTRNHVDTGDVRLVFLAFPNIGSYSRPAAVWGRCVWRQVAESDPTAYWHWNAAAFDAQAESGTDWADEETFREVTKRTDGVSLSDVEQCRQNRAAAIEESFERDLNIAQGSGIRGTPGFVFYNRESGAAGRLTGAHPYENFADAIERVRNA